MSELNCRSVIDVICIVCVPVCPVRVNLVCAHSCENLEGGWTGNFKHMIFKLFDTLLKYLGEKFCDFNLNLVHEQGKYFAYLKLPKY
jgi:hypothetical protein